MFLENYPYKLHCVRMDNIDCPCIFFGLKDSGAIYIKLAIIYKLRVKRRHTNKCHDKITFTLITQISSFVCFLKFYTRFPIKRPEERRDKQNDTDTYTR